ncbi:MAG: alanine--tRNA ligase [Cuspidothrix sp.]
MMPTHPTTTAEIREAFLAFFETKHGHKRQHSASLVPADNPTVLLTPAGMLPFVPIFLGIEPAPNPPRVTTAQKCARVSGKASDLEAVGRTPRHHTFFEMMGNFSFGDYFKHEVIPWAWEFVTSVLGLPPERLWVSVFREDDESYDIWHTQVGIPAERIFRCDEKDNFWGPPGPSGPCGPCTEIHYDLTQNPNDDLDTRLIEIWNLVFMELFQDTEGNRRPLEKKNVDTGAGLERLAMVAQGVNNTFETDILKQLIETVASTSGVPYGQSEATDVALKIIADHLRFVLFAMVDGALPSNEGRGYVVRMILRRAVRYGKQYLGLQQPFLHTLLPTVHELYHTAYPELTERLAIAVTTTQREEARFLETLDKGNKHLQELIETLQANQQTQLAGEAAFKLYDTYGFPVELTNDILQEHHLSLDEAGFEHAMNEAKALARAGRKTEALVEDELYSQLMSLHGKTPFVGYESLEAPVTVLGILVDGHSVESVSGTNQPCTLILNQTPFYAESGGQVGDVGQLSADAGQQSVTVLITDTQKKGTLVIHDALFDQGEALRVGDTLMATVDPAHRYGSQVHHSATHLVHAALKHVCGQEASQAGSYVSAEGARFDFSFPRGLTSDELNQVEGLVNRWIFEGHTASIQHMSLPEAKASGATAMFGEKYGDTVRVVSFGSVSKELCGGTHVDSVTRIGLVRLTNEQAVASGVRRLEFVAGYEAYRQFRQQDNLVKHTCLALKALPQEVLPRLNKLQEDLKQRDKTITQLNTQLAMSAKAELIVQLQQASASGSKTPWVAHTLPDTDAEALKRLGEAVMNEARVEGVLVLASTLGNEKVNLLCWASEAVVKQQGVKAGDIIKQLATQCGGGGGGKPTFAQAGGKDVSKLPEALASLSTLF